MLINGKAMDLGKTVSITELLQHLKLDADKIVVEVNMEIIPRERYSMHLAGEDQVELISFVGGG